MATEIERKFLVDGDFLSHFTKAIRITQGYISTDPSRTIRVRYTSENECFLTIKGKSTDDGLSRSEWEYAIPLHEGKQMLKTMGGPTISKVRYLVPYDYVTFEVDVFLGMNQGLVVAEVELIHTDQQVHLPDWVGEEVTGDPRYYNSALLQNPYTKW